MSFRFVRSCIERGFRGAQVCVLGQAEHAHREDPPRHAIARAARHVDQCPQDPRRLDPRRHPVHGHRPREPRRSRRGRCDRALRPVTRRRRRAGGSLDRRRRHRLVPVGRPGQSGRHLQRRCRRPGRHARADRRDAGLGGRPSTARPTRSSSACAAKAARTSDLAGPRRSRPPGPPFGSSRRRPSALGQSNSTSAPGDHARRVRVPISITSRPKTLRIETRSGVSVPSRRTS